MVFLSELLVFGIIYLMDEWEVELKGLILLAGVGLFFSSSIFNLLALVIIMSVIYVHEKGHAAAARFVGVEIEEVSVGIGQAVLRRHRAEGPNTVFRALPFGGYNIVEDNFNEKTTYGQKVLVSGGGILANFLTGVLALVAFFFLWGVGGEGEVSIIESLKYNLEEMKHTSQVVIPDLEHLLLTGILVFASLNILFGLVQLIPLTFFDGARMVEYTLSHLVSSRRRQYWEVQGNMLGKVWAGGSVLFFLFWLFLM